MASLPRQKNNGAFICVFLAVIDIKYLFFLLNRIKIILVHLQFINTFCITGRRAMTSANALDKVLPLFQVYYDIRREDVTEPFQAEAAFHSHDEQYFLIKSAKYTEMDAHEYVFFAALDHLTLADAQRLDESAWAEGLSRVQPSSIHRSTDIGLVLLADRVDPDAAEYIRKLRRSKSYKLLLHGYSNYRAIAIETSSGAMTCNRLGQHLKKLFSNINFIE